MASSTKVGSRLSASAARYLRDGRNVSSLLPYNHEEIRGQGYEDLAVANIGDFELRGQGGGMTLRGRSGINDLIEEWSVSRAHGLAADEPITTLFID